MKKMMSTSERISNVKSALWFAQNSVPRFVMQETGMAAYEAVKAIIPALMVSLAFVTLTTVVGAGVGAAIGSLGAGVGAVPLGIAGGGVGFKAGLWILNIVGLAFLIEYMGSSLWEATRHIEAGIRQAWGPTEEWPHFPYDGDVFKASDKIALGVAIVIRCILEGIVLYLTVKGISKLPELIANLKRSKFGETFAIWVERNYQQMLSNPKLNRRVGTGAAKEQPAKVLTDHTTMQEQPRPGQTKDSITAKDKQIKKNKEKGDAFAKKRTEAFKQKADNVENEITVKTNDGTKTRLDSIGHDKETGNIRMQEYKSSDTAPLTKNQTQGFPQIENSGAEVVGKGKGAFTGGTKIPPTKVEIIRP